LNLPFFIARRYLVKQKGTFSSFIIKIAIVATALSVAVMILSAAVITGFKTTITEKLFAFNGHVHLETYDPTNSNSLTLKPLSVDNRLISEIKKIPHVQQVFPFTQRPTIIQVHNQIEGIQLKGIDKDFHFLKGITLTGKQIDFTDSAYAKQIILSQTTANRLSVAVGDTVQLNFIEAGSALPRIRRVTVAGIYHSGMEEIDKSFGICDTRLLQRINNWQANNINGYQINLENEKYSDTVANYIISNLVSNSSGITAYTIPDLYAGIYDWLSITNTNSMILLVIMGIVAIINMATVLLIVMVDRTTMIGILKSLGMSYGGTRNIFLYIAALVGIAGTLGGNLLALVLCWIQTKYGIIQMNEDTYYMKYAPVKIIWWQVGLIDVVTLLLCVLCMWLPTLYIRRIQPAKVLQFK